jgi:pimeloyl-ACP methyl ester carboxylesterase
MHKWLFLAATLGSLATASQAALQKGAGNAQKPTIILVHGAFAGSSSWTPVISQLAKDGFPVIAAANPLRSLKGDAEYVAQIVKSIPGPVVLVGHSYAGSVVSMAAVGQSNVKALVFVAGFAPLPGESPVSLGKQFPTGTLGETLAPPVKLLDGNEDLYITQAKYWKQFAADVPQSDAIVMASTQRPITSAGLGEGAGPVAWDRLPSWFVWGAEDRNIPAALHAFMARRAHAKEAVAVPGASHVVMLTHSKQVADMIERAALAK